MNMAQADATATTPQPRHRIFAAVYDLFANAKSIRAVRSEVAGGAHGAVLEVGCGTGLNLGHYDWTKVEALTATEPDPFMFKRIQPKLDALPVDVRARVRIEQAPAEALPFADASFDTVVSTLVLCTVAQPDRAISEIRRVLTSGGELRLFEHVRGRGLLRRIQSIIQPIYGWTAGDCQLSRETEAAVRDAGFELQVAHRASLGPLWPAFVGVAKKTESPGGIDA